MTSRRLHGSRAHGFRLGPPGAVVRLTYPLVSRGERTMTLAAWVVFALIALALTSASPWFAILALTSLVGFARSASASRVGHVVLDDDTLTMGPASRARTMPVADVTASSHSRVRAHPFARAHEQWVVTFVDRSRGPYAVPAFAVALLDADVADELATRIALRARALSSGDARAVAGLEALHEAGQRAIGVYLQDGVWRAFDSVDDLDAVANTPFRDVERVPVCVRERVLRLFETIASESARRLEPIGVMP